MANTKISQLPSATTPVVGTEVLPIVQSSTTSKVSIANLTAGRAVSASSYDATGATAPANGMFLTATNTLAFSTASGQVASFLASSSGGSFTVDDSSSAGTASQRYINVRNKLNDGAAYAWVGPTALNTGMRVASFSPTHSNIYLANKSAVFGLDATSTSSGTVIADFSTGTNQIQFYVGTLATPVLAGTINSTGDWEVGLDHSNDGIRYLQVTNVSTGTSAYASATTRSDVQTFNLQSSSSTRSASGGVTLAGKAVLLASPTSGGVTSTGLTIWDKSTSPQIDFVVGTTYAGTIGPTGNWLLYDRGVQAGSFTPTSSSLQANAMYLPSANTISITNNSAVTATFTSLNNFDVGTGNPTNASRSIQAVNVSTLSSAFASVTARSDVQYANLQAYSSTYPAVSGITTAGKAVLYAAGSAGSSGLTLWDNSAAPTIQFVVGSTSAGTINSSAVLSLTNNPILTGGIANGVAYLNGSKALTTGSALVFDGANLGVGQSSPRAKLDVNGGIILGNSQNLSWGNVYGAAIPLIAASSTVGIDFYANGSTSGLQMRLDAAGNLGLGVTPSAWGSSNKAIDVASYVSFGYRSATNGTVVSNNSYLTSGDVWTYKNNAAASAYQQIGGVHYWSVAASGTASTTITGFNTAAMTLDASGNLLVGRTSQISTGRLCVQKTSGNNNSIEASQPDSGGYNFFSFAASNGGSYYHASFTEAGTQRGSIVSNGTATLYNTTSDQRLKENIVDAPEFGSVIDSIQVRSYDWKSDGSHQRYGFIAQELVTVAPEAVHQPTDTDEMMAVDYSKLVPMLVKEIQSLRQRLAALEAK